MSKPLAAGRVVGKRRRRRSDVSKPRLPSITTRVVDGIADATAAIAAGKTLHEAAAVAGASYQAMRDWQRLHPQLWQHALDHATQQMLAVVRRQAGSDAVLENIDEYLRAAASCERWAAARGESLFPSGGAPTLTSFYKSHYRPHRLSDARSRTLEKYEDALQLWKLLTADPPIQEIGSDTLVKFRDALARRRGRRPGSKASPNSVRTTLRTLQAIVDAAGPAGWRNRDAAGIIDRVPYARPPREVRRTPSIIDAQRISDVYLACVAAELPRVDNIKPPAWWKAIIVTAYNSGLRISTLLSLRWSNIDFDRRLLQLEPGQVKTGIAQTLPINAATAAHLVRIRGDRELVFHWPHARTTFYDHFHAIQRAAGVPAAEFFGLHALRRTAATILWEQNPAAAQLLCGHTTQRTTQNYYVNGHDILTRAVDAMPQPVGFKGGAA